MQRFQSLWTDEYHKIYENLQSNFAIFGSNKKKWYENDMKHRNQVFRRKVFDTCNSTVKTSLKILKHWDGKLDVLF